MPKYVGLIGYPLKHSISPYFQQAALDYYQLDIRYQAWETEPDRLPDVVKGLRDPDKVGANVTTPYKQAVVGLLDEVDDLAKLIGAVNTIVKRGGRLIGFNTDAYGFCEALEKEGHFDPAAKRVVVLGAGGVARAATFVLAQERIASLAITDGIFERAAALARNLQSYARSGSVSWKGQAPEIRAFPWADVSSPTTFANCDLIVHCTTMGMKDSPQEGQSALKPEVIPRNILVYDVVYNPRLTPLLRLAQQAGANTLDGLPMLVYQGAASFELWTDKEAPVEIMLNRAEEMLTG